MGCFFMFFNFRNFMSRKVCLLDSTKEHNDISFEKLEKNEVVNATILNQVVDVSFENCNERSFRGSFEKQFGRVLEKLQLEQPCHGKQIIECVESFHVFYDPVVEYMDKFFSWGNDLFFHQNDKFRYHNLLPLNSYVLISLKHDEKVYLLDQLLDWIHWKSNFT